MYLHLILFKDWLTGNEPNPSFWKMMYPELKLAARVDFLEWDSIMGISPSGDRDKPEWLIISSEASKYSAFI